MDPLTLSLNSTRPTALRGLVRLLAWAPSHSREDLEAEIREAIAEHIGVAQDPSLAVQSVLGEGVATLAQDAAWFDARCELLFGPQDGAELTAAERAAHDVVWTTMLATHRPSKWMLTRFEPYFRYYALRLSSDASPAAGWRTMRNPDQQLADHILIAYVNGWIDFGNGSILDAYFEHAPVEQRADALAHLGWLLGKGSSLEIDERAARLWEWRADEVRVGRADPQELAGFEAWVRSGRFSASWWLPHLVQAAELSTIDTKMGLGPALVEAAQGGLVEGAMAALYALSQKIEEPWQSYELVQSSPPILRAALRSGDPHTVDLAGKAMDHFARLGHIEIARLVREVSDG